MWLALHRLLQLRPGGDAAFDRGHPLDADLVVDEASMLDVLLANKLVKAIPPGAHLRLVGDVDQLHLGIHRLVDRWQWLAAHPSMSGGAALVLGGVFQFSSLKDRCLTVCRHPAAYLLPRYRRGVGAAFRLGAGHGVFCVGYCWALMLVAFPAGVANLWWMAALTAVMVFEKTGPAGQRGVRLIGVGLVGLGVLALANPSGPPSL
jgi:predicted metal-binding membrane protein